MAREAEPVRGAPGGTRLLDSTGPTLGRPAIGLPCDGARTTMVECVASQALLGDPAMWLD